MITRMLRTCCLLLVMAVLFGCSPALQPGETAGALLVIRWPSPSRLMPAACASIKVTLANTRGYQDSRVVDRPSAGQMSTVLFEPIPTGAFTVTAVAYPQAGAAGTPQAQGTTTATVEAGARASLSLTMASTITKLTIDPASFSLVVGGTQQMKATPADATGALVLIPANGVTWAVTGTAATIDAASGLLTAAGAGTAQITATETESGVTATATVTVTPKLTGKIAFLSTRDGNSEVYLMNPDGTNQRNLTNNPANDNEISFSPDGSQILFISDRDGSVFHLFIMNSDGTNVRQLTTGTQDEWGPIFTPDSTQILFFRTTTNGDEIFIMNADTTNQRQLTNNNVGDVMPSMTPDQQWVIYEEQVGKNYTLFRMKADGTGAQALTSTDVDSEYHCISPDGSKIAYSESNHITTINVDGSRRQQLTFPSGYQDRHPWYSPDGAYIAFASTRDGQYEIYVMDADGKNPRRLTTGTSLDYFPIWGP